MSGTLTTSGMAAGLLSGQKTIGPQTMVGINPVGTITDITLASGDNTIAVPAGAETATAVLIVFPTTNAAELKIRTNLNSADGGLPVGLLGYMVFPLYAGTTAIVVNAAAASGILEATFI
jgi:hypothetical protein